MACKCDAEISPELQAFHGINVCSEDPQRPSKELLQRCTRLQLGIDACCFNYFSRFVNEKVVNWHKGKILCVGKVPKNEKMESMSIDSKKGKPIYFFAKKNVYYVSIDVAAKNYLALYEFIKPDCVVIPVKGCRSFGEFLMKTSQVFIYAYYMGRHKPFAKWFSNQDHVVVSLTLHVDKEISTDELSSPENSPVTQRKRIKVV